VYSLHDYGEMIGDDARVAKYIEALRSAVKPGSVVLDIGTGTGVLSLVACRLGARRVFAVEPDDVIELARRIAAANGMEGRIEFIQGLSTQIDLPERADVIVAEIHGILPLFQKSVATLIDARRRLLAPGGIMIPARETVWASVVEAPALHARLRAPWERAPDGVDLTAGLVHATNYLQRATFSPGQLLAAPARWASLDYSTLDGTDVANGLSLRVERGGVAHGIAMWFDSVLAEGIELSNAPGRPPLIFGNAYFPWPEAVQVRAGDEIELDVSARLVGDRYLWRWRSRVAAGGRDRASFDQSPFDSALLVPAKLRRRAATHVPRLNQEGEIERFVLERMAQARPLGEIAHELAQRYPSRFARWQEALSHVGDLALRCSD
jgi:protein arginine N-methyltransferase 1